MDTDPLWEQLGMTGLDARVYRWLLGEPAAAPAAIAAGVDAAPEDVDRSLTVLQTLGLVRLSGRQPKVTALDPRATLVPLARQRQSTLDRVAAVADELATHLAAHRLSSDPANLVQFLHGADEILGRLVSMFAGATRDAVSLVAPPYVSDLDSELGRAEMAMLERGVGMRAVYDTSFVEDPAHLENLREGLRVGESARLYPGLTTKMIMVDGAVAIMPLRLTDGQPAAVAVAHSSITDALSLLFEQLWADAVPAPSPLDRPRGAAVARDQIIEMLSCGLSDTAIAKAVGISERTVRRQVANLQAEHHASSRFQLGWLLARGGQDSARR